MKQLQLTALAALLSLGCATAQTNDRTRVTYQEVAVHDPSIVVDGNNYYVFGSHLATARSTDMLNWTYFGGANLMPARLCHVGAQGGLCRCYTHTCQDRENYRAGGQLRYLHALDWQ
jgi:arabinan endo-1,5-alpha-L-arabinosidase